MPRIFLLFGGSVATPPDQKDREIVEKLIRKYGTLDFPLSPIEEIGTMVATSVVMELADAPRLERDIEEALEELSIAYTNRQPEDDVPFVRNPDGTVSLKHIFG